MEKEPTPPAGPARPLAGSLTVLAGILRLVPHWWNFTPVTALGLYGGARLPLAQALTLPLAVMALSDVILHYVLYPGFPPFHPWVYAGLVINVLLGRLLRHTNSPAKIAAVVLVAGVQFFLLTNFGAWLGSPIYPQTPAGLATCYAAGLAFVGPNAVPPLGFFGNMVAGDLLFTAALFGLHAVLARTAFPAERVRVAVQHDG